MTKMPGQRLSSGWFDLSKSQQEAMLSQISDQLRLFHSISFDTYAIPRPLQNSSWKDALRAYTDLPEQAPEQADERTRANFATLRNFYLEHESVLSVATAPVLVHNDIHFDNVLHQNGMLTGILDFDFARQAPRDYELRQIIDFFQSPKYLVSERDEPVWDGFEATDELRLLRKYYPELFDSPDMVTRQKLYLTETIVTAMRDGAFYKFNEKVETYFNTEWLERVLS
ncbi:hypothetical protein A2348_03985 [Candidatus Uhrbacteria bacterium RIFOXYB12_FULL_58_10]|nr:MAG: hypothetical protein A2348_03985 [Candidatus Uhrbacteria bacterium RIFOXYB12_FULL_58_10]